MAQYNPCCASGWVHTTSSPTHIHIIDLVFLYHDACADLIFVPYMTYNQGLFRNSNIYKDSRE